MSFSERKKIVIATLLLTIALAGLGVWKFSQSYAEVAPVRFSQDIVKQMAVGDYSSVFSNVAADSPLSKATLDKFTSVMQKNMQLDKDPQIYLVDYSNNRGQGAAHDSSTVILQIDSRTGQKSYRIKFDLVKESGDWRINDFSFVPGVTS